MRRRAKKKKKKINNSIKQYNSWYYNNSLKIISKYYGESCINWSLKQKHLGILLFGWKLFLLIEYVLIEGNDQTSITLWLWAKRMAKKKKKKKGKKSIIMFASFLPCKFTLMVLKWLLLIAQLMLWEFLYWKLGEKNVFKAGLIFFS